MSVRAAATEATRNRSVAAAQDAFMSQWYGDVTVRGIAASAGVALQTVLNHFPTKETLCAAHAETITAMRELVVALYEKRGELKNERTTPDGLGRRRCGATTDERGSGAG